VTLFFISSALLFAISFKWGKRFRFLKGAGLFLSLLFLTIALAFHGFMRVLTDEPLAQVIIPGVRSEAGYLVKISSAQGEPITEHYIQGDLVGIRAKIIRTKPLFTFLGLQTLCRIELMHSSYLKKDAFEKLPHSAYEISFEHARFLPKFFEEFWESLFFEHASSFWVRSATLESSYFPLVNRKSLPYQGSFLLTLTSSGLSSTAFEK
jgi:hypothetical protein